MTLPRSLSKTVEFLTREFSAVDFKFLNKVGENSLPNGIAIQFGEFLSTDPSQRSLPGRRRNPVLREAFNRTSLASEWPSVCKYSMDNETNSYVVSRFGQVRY